MNKIAKRDGTLLPPNPKEDRLLRFLYGNAFGRMLLKPMIQPWVSKLAGKFLCTRASKVFIKSFIRKHQIDMNAFEPVKYSNYNEFFSRRIRPEMRPVDQDPGHFISPCDCKLTCLPIEEGLHFTLKHTEYTLSSLLKDEALAKQFAGGQLLIFRLTVDDYHRYCFNADGRISEAVRIPGVFHTVNPLANDHFPIYKENTREYCILSTEAFGDILVMEVGATLVGKIVNHGQIGDVCRGQEKGYFQFGGSTVIQLLKKDAVQIDADILKNSRENIETIVRMGEKIGVKKA